MKIQPEQLAADLRKGLRPVYLVSGDEPLLMQEACDQIRAAARERGFAERDLFDIEASFDWQQLLYSANSMSLFGDKKLIELRMPGGKPGNQGGAALQSFCELGADDRVLLIVTGRLERNTQGSAWFRRVSDAGAYVEVRTIELAQMPAWLNDRIKRAGMSADREAVLALMEKVEGNLLAAVQEIERIRLVAGGGRIDITTVTDEVGDSARFTVFRLIDAALAGDGRGTLRVLQGLRDEGIAVLQIAFWLAREIRQLAKMSREVAGGKSIDAVMRGARVWSNRTRIVGSALRRHDPAAFEAMIVQLARLDRLAKGGEGENPWDLLGTIMARLAGVELAARAPSRRRSG